VAKVLYETCAEQSISQPVRMFWAIVDGHKPKWSGGQRQRTGRETE